ncbi:cryptochrome/photolyase family protein [Adhaeretor mobilis]|uniref:Deoxyribodipyrimidine photo-lyase n=1 Tax=Adhaeretor mobilis TaxID=1930276 RepID=A0A517MZN4_9BACT|nr:deoxyribodipyrimidine photo-lyase [Adhaeretor mobilis]QDT00341.1 Deoxyribodipyrimidine photo-lyase [Adhaeretor mobilis]
MSTSTTILWYRQDLRLADHPALLRAADRGTVLPVFIWAPEEEGDWPLGGASKWWLHHSLDSLTEQLEGMGSRLILRQGNSLKVLSELIQQTGASAVYWSRRYEPAAIERDQRVKSALKQDGIEVKSFNGSLLYEPWEIETKAGGPYKVFTPFWKACRALHIDHDPREPPEGLISPRRWPKSVELADLKLLPEPDWDSQFYETWDVGARAAEDALNAFISEGRLGDYQEARNRLDVQGWSQLSPRLHFGEISPRQVWASVKAAYNGAPSLRKSSDTYLSEIGWREFAYHLLYYFPSTTNEPLREKFAVFPWDEDNEKLQKWQRGQTGYPVVDAAMRDLWATGFMPNRARMIVASFLTKHLRIPWQRGAEWFWDTLCDADLASNSLGWQWTAGCGADAAPYFRIFNPMTQGEKFDPDGDYVRRWVPEIAGLPNKVLDKPWEASEEQLEEAGITLGKDYPHPMVDHFEARDAALAAYNQIK